MRGGDGVPWPAAGADFLESIFFFLRDFVLVFIVVAVKRGSDAGDVAEQMGR